MRRRAATLIELLVVIALIGLLIGILVPSLGRSMDLAAATVCKHNLRTVYQALHTYRTENDGWLPTVVSSDATQQMMGEPSTWFVQLYPIYLADPAVLGCPEDPFRFRIAKSGKRSQFSEEVRADYSSYGLNSFLMTAGGGKLADLDRSRPLRPHDTILMGDIGPDNVIGNSGMQIAGAFGPTRNYSLLAWDDGYDPFTGRSVTPWLTTRHNDGVHMVTLGGAIREGRTRALMKNPLRNYYDDCAAGRCSLCNELQTLHYSFAKDHLFWWTGRISAE